jgi:hypothetical protein
MVLDAQFALPTFQAAQKPYNYVLNLNGSNSNNRQRVHLSNSAALRPDAFTIQLWVNPDVVETANLVFRVKTYSILMSSSAFGGFVRGSGAPSPAWQGDWSSDITPPSTNVWYHIVLTFASSVTKLYVNGNNVATTSTSGYTTNQTNQYVGIGDKAQTQDDEPFDGQIDEFAFWNEALTASEITALYNSGNGLNAYVNSTDYTSSSNLVSYLQMQSNVNSRTGNNHGTFEGSGTGDYINTSLE